MASEDPKVQRLRQVQRDLIALGKASASKMQKQHLQIGEIHDRWDLSFESRKEGVKLAWESFAAEAAQVHDMNRQLRAEHSQLITELTASHRQPGGAHEEMLRQAAWSRMEKTLDTLDRSALRFQAADQLLDAAHKVGDTATLEAARRELPAYLARHNEAMPAPMRVWLDTNAGPPETRAARTLHAIDETDLAVANMAVGKLDQAVSKRELPGVIPYPSGVEGQRVTFLSDEHEQRATR